MFNVLLSILFSHFYVILLSIQGRMLLDFLNICNLCVPFFS